MEDIYVIIIMILLVSPIQSILYKEEMALNTAKHTQADECIQ